VAAILDRDLVGFYFNERLIDTNRIAQRLEPILEDGFCAFLFS